MRFARRSLVLSIALLVVFAANEARGGDKTRIAGTNIWIDVPKGYGPAANFVGLQNAEVGTSIMVTTMEAPFAEATKGFDTKSMLLANRMSQKSREVRKMGKHPGVLYRFFQLAAGGSVEKWIWAFGDDKRTILVMATCPVKKVALEFGTLEVAVCSAEWRPDAKPDPAEALFELGRTEGMKIFRRVGTGLVYTEDGKVVDKPGKPTLVVVYGVATSDISNRLRFAETTIRAVAGYERVDIVAHGTVKSDGLPGQAVEGRGHRADGTKDSLYLVAFFEGRGTWVLTGSVAEERSEEFLPKFRRIAKSFKRRRIERRAKSGRFKVTVPATWRFVDTTGEADLFIGNEASDCYFAGHTTAKDGLDDMKLKTYAELVVKSLLESGDRVIKKKSARIGGRAAMWHELRVTEEGTELRQIVACVEGKKHFHLIMCWTANTPECPPLSELDKVIRGFRELR